MSNSTGIERLFLVGIGVLFLLLSVVGLAVVANRLSCGGWASPDGPIGVLQFFATADLGHLGTYQGCSAELGTLIWMVAALLMLVLIVVIAVFVAWKRYKQSDKYLIRQLIRREGMAQPDELRRLMGPKKMKEKASEVRPTLGKKALKDYQTAGFWRGTARGVKLYVTLEESQLLLGPPRSGKGVSIVVGDIIDAPGPVITTSSRADNLAMTMDLRKKPLPGQTENRPVAIFDPQGISGQSTTFKWSPITGCEKPQVANQRATSLISSTGLDENSNNSEWAAPAITIMECLLHAAALGNKTVDDLMVWGNSEAEAKAAVRILKSEEKTGRAAIGWAESLESIINQDPRMRGNQWFGVRNAVKGLAVPNVRDALKPQSQAETFDIDEFLDKCGTLYVIGTKTGGSSAGPFLIAMMDAITERARELAAQRPGNRLDPPLSLILDEIANIAKAWPGLIPLMADGGGVGINPHPIFQSMSQIKENWGADAAGALFEAANVMVQLKGSKDTENLKVIQDLAGTYEYRRDSRSRSKDGTSTSEQFEQRNVIEIEEMRRLPFGWGLILAPGSRLIFAKLRPHFQRKDAKEIKQAKKDYYAAHNIEDNENSPMAGQARGWNRQSGNQEQNLEHVLGNSSQTPEETKAQLNAEASQRNRSVLDAIPGQYWDDDSGTIGAERTNGTSEVEVAKYRPAPAGQTTVEPAEDTAGSRGINWG